MEHVLIFEKVNKKRKILQIKNPTQSFLLKHVEFNLPSVSWVCQEKVHSTPKHEFVVRIQVKSGSIYFIMFIFAWKIFFPSSFCMISFAEFEIKKDFGAIDETKYSKLSKRMTKLEIKIISLFITFSWYQRFDKSRAGSFANLSIISRFGIPGKKQLITYSISITWKESSKPSFGPNLTLNVRFVQCAKLSYLTVDIFWLSVEK